MAFFNQPVAGVCCPDPCTRSGPCDPCECPETICATDNRGASVDYSGTYNENGTYGGSIAYEKADSSAWFWRDWAGYPSEGWWTVSGSKGSLTNSVTQGSTQPGGDPCPNALFPDTSESAWRYSLGSGPTTPDGNVVAGAC